MAKPYSMDLRERAMRRVGADESAHSVAAVLKVSTSSVIKWAQRQRRTGSFAPGKMGGHRSLRLSHAPGAISQTATGPSRGARRCDLPRASLPPPLPPSQLLPY
jgi:hypothetical protein